MPVKISVETVSQIEMGAMAMKVSLTPGVGFWNVAMTLALRGPTMWKLSGRPVSSMSDQNGSYAGSHSGLPPRSSGKGSQWKPRSPILAMRLSSAMPSSMSSSGTCARPTRRFGAAFDSSTIQSL